MSSLQPHQVPDRISHPIRKLTGRKASPQLLVSVRNREEARLALSAGLKILDVKEPNQGSLGRAKSQFIKEIGQEIEADPEIFFSVAMGELRDFSPEDKLPELPQRVDFLKVGMAGCQSDPDWRGHYRQLQQQMTEQTSKSHQWVAVIYADQQTADAPTAAEVLDFTFKNDLSGILVDTYNKNGLSLLDHLSLDEIGDIVQKCHSANRFIALAGSLKREEIPELIPLSPDIIAVRGAACSENNRKATLDLQRLNELSTLLNPEPFSPA